jgi:Right handed beta helix region/PKD domain
MQKVRGLPVLVVALVAWAGSSLPAVAQSAPKTPPVAPPGAAAATPAARSATPAPETREPLVIRKNTTLDPSVTYGPILIAASDITIDGRGALIEGARVTGTIIPGAPVGAPDPSTRFVDSTKDFTGVGIAARGVSGVTLTNVKVRGFRIGLQVDGGENWTIQDCDFSDNFHDPDFGWGEQPPGGGIALTDVRQSRLIHDRANRTWDACSLLRCRALLLQSNDFSHSSNTCLKLWASTGNLVRENDLSWGLRIAPGETHARDSACVLIESGSDDNQFTSNNATHGGDGFFIRVLNGWTSRNNAFMENDASYANNNGFEAWSPGARYLSNRANHCSYGFWLGASEGTTLIDNEAGWNGLADGFHNAPEAFGHGGIVFVNGPSAHTTLRGNHCHDNDGGGIVLRGDLATQGEAWKAFHWIIADNVLERNRWGIFLQYAEWIDLWPNVFTANTDAEIFNAGGVMDLTKHARDRRAVPSPRQIKATGPTSAVRVGEDVLFDARLEKLPGQRFSDENVVWNFIDGSIVVGEHVDHAWERPGLKRVGVTADDGSNAALGWLDVFVVDDAPELGTEREPPAATSGEPDSPDAPSAQPTPAAPAPAGPATPGGAHGAPSAPGAHDSASGASGAHAAPPAWGAHGAPASGPAHSSTAAHGAAASSATRASNGAHAAAESVAAAVAAAPRGANFWDFVDESGKGRATFKDETDALVGSSCVHAHIEPYDGGRAGLLYPTSHTLGLPLADATVLHVWMKVRDPNIPAWQGTNPVITLYESPTRWRRLVPDRDWLASPDVLASRDDWNLIQVPLAGGEHWKAEDAPEKAASGGAGGAPATLNWLVLGVDSWGNPPLDVRVDGLVIR